MYLFLGRDRIDSAFKDDHFRCWYMVTIIRYYAQALILNFWIPEIIFLIDAIINMCLFLIL